MQDAFYIRQRCLYILCTTLQSNIINVIFVDGIIFDRWQQVPKSVTYLSSYGQTYQTDDVTLKP